MRRQLHGMSSDIDTQKINTHTRSYTYLKTTIICCSLWLNSDHNIVFGICYWCKFQRVHSLSDIYVVFPLIIINVMRVHRIEIWSWFVVICILFSTPPDCVCKDRMEKKKRRKKWMAMLYNIQGLLQNQTSVLTLSLSPSPPWRETYVSK